MGEADYLLEDGDKCLPLQKKRLRSFKSKSIQYFISSTCILCDDKQVFEYE